MDEFKLNKNEKIVWKCETDGETWSVWPIVDDGNPDTYDELTERTFAYREHIGMTRVNPKRNRIDVTRNSKKAVDVWLNAHGLGLTFDSIASLNG